MKYKVGDKVRVRKDLERMKVYGGNLTYDSMTFFRGRIVTIAEDNCVGDVYTIKEDGSRSVWTDEMFEGLANEAPSITRRINNKNNAINGLTNTDTIKPDYYQFHGYDVFDIAEHFGLSFPLGNALKYILRHKDETKRLEDLKKARQCLDRAIELMEKK